MQSSFFYRPRLLATLVLLLGVGFISGGVWLHLRPQRLDEVYLEQRELTLSGITILKRHEIPLTIVNPTSRSIVVLGLTDIY